MSFPVGLDYVVVVDQQFLTWYGIRSREPGVDVCHLPASCFLSIHRCSFWPFQVLYQARLRRGGGVGINDIDAVCVASTSRSIAGGSAGGNVPLHREEPSNMENDDDDML